jgi:hypothetical protein
VTVVIHGGVFLKLGSYFKNGKCVERTLSMVDKDCIKMVGTSQGNCGHSSLAVCGSFSHGHRYYSIAARGTEMEPRIFVNAGIESVCNWVTCNNISLYV